MAELRRQLQSTVSGLRARLDTRQSLVQLGPTAGPHERNARRLSQRERLPERAARVYELDVPGVFLEGAVVLVVHLHPAVDLEEVGRVEGPPDDDHPGKGEIEGLHIPVHQQDALTLGDVAGAVDPEIPGDVDDREVGATGAIWS